MSSNKHRPKWTTCYAMLFFLLCTFAKNHAHNLEESLTKTAIFFENLKMQYGSFAANIETLESIDTRVNEFLEESWEYTRHRSRRQLYQHDNDKKELGILAGFEVLPTYSIPSASDVSFFIRSSADQLHWFIATINPDGVSLFKLNGASYVPVTFFPLENGKLILTNSKDFTTLIIIQQFNGIIKVLQLSLTSDKLVFSLVQTLPTTGSNHASTWTGMDRLYLGVSSPGQITIYSWLGENFDQVQVLDLPSEKLIPLQTGSSMVLGAIGPITRIISFQLKSDEFIVTQELKSSKGAAGFQIETGVFGDNFLILTEETSTIIYKEWKHRYVPFQKLEGTHEVQALSNDQKVLLFFIQNEGMKVFQYDGWRFADLQINAPEVTRVYPMFSPDGVFVLATRTCDETRWSFFGIIWKPAKNRQNTDETGIWCKPSLRLLKEPRLEISSLIHPLVFSEVEIGNLAAVNVNGRSASDLLEFGRVYQHLSFRLEKENQHVETRMTLDNSVFANVTAKTVKVTKLIATILKTSLSHDFTKKLRTSGVENKTLMLKNVKIWSIEDFGCPVPAISYEQVTVTGLINGVVFESFIQDTLMLNDEEQLVTVPTVFDILTAREGNLSLNLASNFTLQALSFTTLTVEELNQPSGYFLPVNGDAVTINGELTVPRAQIAGLVHLRGPITGENRERLRPITDITEPITLTGDVYLENVKVVDLLKAENLVGPNEESYKTIRKNVLPLNSREIPMHVTFHNKNVQWQNVMMMDSFGNWITKNSALNITGRKTVGNFTLPQFCYDQLPSAVIIGKVCITGLVASDIYTANITINNAYVISLSAARIFDAQEMNQVFSDSVKSWDEVPWGLKSITGEVRVKNASVSEFSDLDLLGLEESWSKWSASGALSGPVRVKNLKITQLQADKGFRVPLPKTINRFEALGNVNITRINQIMIQKFMDSCVKLNDMISLTNVTFLGGLEVSNVIASVAEIPFVANLMGHFGSKVVDGTFRTQHLVILDILRFPPADNSVEFTVIGNVSFVIEPHIKNLNNIRLEKLSQDIWMKNRPAIMTAKGLHLKNMTLVGAVDVTGELNTPGLGPWSKIGRNSLSSLPNREINHKKFFKSLKVVKIFGANSSKLIASLSTSLYNLEYNTLKKNRDQIISLPWSFEKVIIQGGINIRGVVNDMDFNREVLRTDVTNNVITGSIIVDNLTAGNVDGLNFYEFAKNTLKFSNPQELVVIKGKKTFRNVKVKDLYLTSTVRGKRIISCLLKYSYQHIIGKKTVKGKLKALGIVTDGLINDVNLAWVLTHQLKKNSSLQVIESPIVLQNDFHILGDLTIDRPFQGIQLNQFKAPDSSVLRLSNLSRQLQEFANFAKAITALERRKFYFDKLELLEENSTKLSEKPSKRSVKFNLSGDCHIDNLSLHCGGMGIFNFSGAFNCGTILEIQAVIFEEIPYVVCIAASGKVVIYLFNEELVKIEKRGQIQLPVADQASIATSMKSIWIVLGVDGDNMVVRFHRDKFHEHLVAGSKHFAISSGFSDELLLFRNDGVWRLGGVTGPKLIFKASLEGSIKVQDNNRMQHVQLNDGNVTSLLRAHYVGH